MLPLLEEYFVWVKSFDTNMLIKSKFRDAIIYSVNQEIPLRNFVLDGRLECSNNKCERSIKPFVIARKNFLFCNTPSGADASAITFSLVETAKENNLNIFKYLEYILDCMSQDNNYDIEKLMPWSDEIPEECRAKIISE
jgi:transposase